MASKAFHLIHDLVLDKLDHLHVDILVAGILLLLGPLLVPGRPQQLGRRVGARRRPYLGDTLDSAQFKSVVA